MRKQRLIACSAVLVAFIAVSSAQAGPDAPGRGAPGKPEAVGNPGKPEAKRNPGKSEMAGDLGKPEGKGEGNKPGAGSDKDKDKDKGDPGKDRDKDELGQGKALAHGALRALIEDLQQGRVKKAELKEHLAKLRDNMAERRKQHQVELKARWGATLAMPPVREELQHHARRMARLNRAMLLAQTELTKDKDKVVERIQKLIDKEQQRHDRAMERFKSMPNTPAASAASAAAAAPAVSAAAKAGDK
ncbi:MAG TPA: hypothetical protein VJN18_09770 [Polyangiaceae bacterium]|nr:hypothetical protein [Polyangiaceae bacterium]